jgi:Tol biopolymer transport system component
LDGTVSNRLENHPGAADSQLEFLRWFDSSICSASRHPFETATISTAANGPDLTVCCSGADVAPDFTWQPDGQKFLFPRQIAGQLSRIYEVTAEKNQQPVRYALQPEDRSNSGLDWSRDGKVFSFMSDK